MRRARQRHSRYHRDRPLPLVGGKIERAIVDVSGDHYVDHEKEPARDITGVDLPTGTEVTDLDLPVNPDELLARHAAALDFTYRAVVGRLDANTAVTGGQIPRIIRSRWSTSSSAAYSSRA